jgi:CRP-like cAMP-binding protein
VGTAVGVQAAAAIAAANATVLGLDIVALGNEIRRYPAVAIELVRQLEARLDWMAAAATERATCAVAGRVAGRLLDLADTLGDTRNGVIELDLPVQQEQLALLAATTRESACKTMRALKKQGILDYRGRRLRIFRPEALAYLRCGERVSGPSRSTDEVIRPRSRSRTGT